jgi:hypothetical protein
MGLLIVMQLLLELGILIMVGNLLLVPFIYDQIGGMPLVKSLDVLRDKRLELLGLTLVALLMSVRTGKNGRQLSVRKSKKLLEALT